jgi:hypothetical protein
VHIFETFSPIPRVANVDEGAFGMHYLEGNKGLHDVVDLLVNGLVPAFRAILENPVANHFDIQEVLAMVNHDADDFEHPALFIEKQMIVDRYLQ